MLSVNVHLHGMHCFQNALAYFATVVGYTRKIFMKLTPARQGGLALFIGSFTLAKFVSEVCHATVTTALA